MTQQTGSQIKNFAVFFLSATALVALMIVGPFYLETCLKLSETANADQAFPGSALSGSTVIVDTRDFGWNVSTQQFCAADFKNLTASTEPLPSSSQIDTLATGHKTLIDLIVQADAK